MEILQHALEETLLISGFVFVALVSMDLLYVYSRGKMATFLVKRPGTQYVLSALLGAIPGCQGVYFSISLHSHGMIGFGALLSAFIATTGDEAFVMLGRIPSAFLLITLILFVVAIASGYLLDRFTRKGGHQHCDVPIFHPRERFSLQHYWTEHLRDHILRKHMVKIVIWTFVTLLIVEGISHEMDLANLLSEKKWILMLGAGLFGMIPQSGPHLVFVNMFAEGTIPFSILLTNMLAQSGHALIPLLPISLRDSIAIKSIGLGLSWIAGSLLLLAGW